MGQNNFKAALSWFFGVFWFFSSATLWWMQLIEGLPGITVIDKGIFNQQTLQVGLTAAIVSLISSIVYMRALLIQGASSVEQVAIFFSGLGLVVCAIAQQFWYFSIGIFFFIISNLIFSRESRTRNLLSVSMLSLVGFALESQNIQMADWLSVLFLSVFIVTGFRLFPAALCIDQEETEGQPLKAWILHGAPATAIALFFIRRTVPFAIEESAIVLKVLILALGFLTIFRSYRAKTGQQREQALLCALAFLLAFSINSQGSVEWGSSAVLSLSLVYFISQSGIFSYEKMKWLGVVLCGVLLSPLSIFGHAMLAVCSSEEFLKNISIAIPILSALGVSIGVMMASGMEKPLVQTRAALGWITFVLFFVCLLQSVWSGVWVSDKDLALISSQAGWAALSIVLVLGLAMLLAHRAIKRSFGDFFKALDFQDRAWSMSLSFLGSKLNQMLVFFEKDFLRLKVFRFFGWALEAISESWMKTESLLVNRSIYATRSLAGSVIQWLEKNQTTDVQYYLIFGIGTVALVLLHFFINDLL